MPNFIRFLLFTFGDQSNIFLIMATNSSKQRRIDKSYKIKYKALKDLEKGTLHKDVARMFEVPKNTLSTWKKTKENIYENYERGLGAERVKPEKFECVVKIFQ